MFVLMMPATRAFVCCVPVDDNPFIKLLEIADEAPPLPGLAVSMPDDSVVWLQNAYDIEDYLPESMVPVLKEVDYGEARIIEISASQWAEFKERDGGEFSDRDARKHIHCEVDFAWCTMTWDDEWDGLLMNFQLETEMVDPTLEELFMEADRR